MLDYTIWFADGNPGGDYMWSFATDEATERTVEQNGGAMFAPLVKNGITHAFTMLKKSHPVVSEPIRQTDEIKIVGRNGKIDLLNALLDAPVFDNRTITEEFVLMANETGTGDYRISDPLEWAELSSKIKEYFNGYNKKVRIVLSHDRGFYYLGTLTASVEPERYRMIIKITADVEPYKYERYSSVEPWIWDDFSFVDGIIREYSAITMDEYHRASVLVWMRNGDVVPQFRLYGNVYDVLIRNIVDPAYTSMGNLVTAKTADSYNLNLISTLSSQLSEIQTKYDAAVNSGGNATDISDRLLTGTDGISAAITSLSTAISAAGGTSEDSVPGNDDINNCVAELSELYDMLVNEVQNNAVQATVDNGVNWFPASFPDYRENGIILNGYRTLAIRTVGFRGLGAVSMLMRGAAL